MKAYDNVPQELKNKPQWVNVWNGSKVPMQTTQRRAASSSHPETWGTFEAAVTNVQNGIYDGIGYVFNDDGLIGIDIDTGFDEDGFLSPLSIDVIKTCQSYTETSRSGRGVHILVRGTLPFKGKNNGNGVEIYKSARYFIVTGRKMVFDSIIENQTAIDYVVEKYFPDVVKDNENTTSQRIYSPIYTEPNSGKISLTPHYPPIPSGMRNISLASLAGQLHNQGCSKGEIYEELLKVNKLACTPPLHRNEIETIVDSVTRYRR